MKFLQFFLTVTLMIFIQSFSAFAQIEVIKGPSHGFGYSVEVDGDYMVVGAPWEPADYLYGAVYIYKFNGTTWELQNDFTLDEQTQDDNFGEMVDISGDYAIASAYYWDDTNLANCGSAWIFKRSGDTWKMMSQQLLTSDRSEADYCSAVAIEGDMAFFGSLGNDNHALKIT
jgi:hypothetical protein